jgi:UTP--glucose-1-phosphate uridylyltransferase
VRQPIQAGLGDAIGYARAFVGEEPFAVLLGDTIFDAPVPVTRQLLAAFEEHSTPILAVEEVPREKVERYGIVEGTVLREGMIQVERLVEKPAPGDTDSNLAIAGRYILTPEVFSAIEATEPGRNEEIQLTDALAAMLPGTGMVAVPIQGRRFDIGNKLDYLRTVMAFALKHEDYAPVVRSFLGSLPNQGGGE